MPIFSYRNKKPVDVFQTTKLPEEFRNQVIMLILDGLPDIDPSSYAAASRGTIRDMFFPDIVQAIRDYHGKLNLLSPHAVRRDPVDELCGYLHTVATTEQALDVIEESFRKIEEVALGYKGVVRIDAEGLVEKLNARFRHHGIGFQYEDGKVVPMSSTGVHDEVVRPALQVLHNPAYAGPNEELRKAFEHFKEGDNKECISLCSSAFESTLQTVCNRRGWKFDPKKATAKHLVPLVLKKGLIPPLYESLLGTLQSLLMNGIPPTRNTMSASHGQGPAIKNTPDHIARFVLHTTAATILMLVEAERAL